MQRAYENQTVLGEDLLVNDAEVCSSFFMICLHDARCSVKDSDDGLGGFSNISVGKKASRHNELICEIEQVREVLRGAGEVTLMGSKYG